MSTPIREQILQALATRTGASRRLAMYDTRDLPITVLQEGDDAPADGRYGLTNVVMPVTFGRAVSMEGVKDDQWYTTLNTELADLIDEIYGTDDTIGGLAHGMDYVSGSVDLLTDAASGGGVAVTVNVRYSFVHGNPYSQDADAAFSDV